MSTVNRNTIKSFILTILLLVVLSIFLILAGKTNNQLSDQYLRGSSNFSHREENLPLKKSISDYYAENNLVKFNSSNCPGPREGDYYAAPFDLNNDGKDDYMVSINFICGYPLRSGSGGQGNYVILMENNGKYVQEGVAIGSKYGISSVLINGRKVIYTVAKLNTAYQTILEWRWNEDLSQYEKGDSDFTVTIKTHWIDGRYYPVYSFYTGNYSTDTKPLKEIESYIPTEENPNDSLAADVENSIDNNRYFREDITGDGVPEIFVKMEQNASNAQEYEILRWEKGNFKNITITGQENNPTWVGFDKIEYKNGQVSMTSHSNGFRGKDFYKIDGNNLTYIRSIGFFAVPGPYSSEYEVRENKTGGESRVVDRRKGNIWTDSFAPYE